MQNEDRLIWIDLEMSGLNLETDRIIEIATVITDSHLNTLAEGPNLAIHQPLEIIEHMDAWNTEQHTKSGLVERVKASRITEAEAQAETLNFLMQYVAEKKSPMCGNSICTDRRFLYANMPKLEQYFHYQNLDVSSFKICAHRWFPAKVIGMNKTSAHRALDDIYDSIAELRYYKDNLFRAD